MSAALILPSIVAAFGRLAAEFEHNAAPREPLPHGAAVNGGHDASRLCSPSRASML